MFIFNLYFPSPLIIFILKRYLSSIKKQAGFLHWETRPAFFFPNQAVIHNLLHYLPIIENCSEVTSKMLDHSWLMRYRKIVPPQNPKHHPLKIPQERIVITETLPNNNPKIPAANIPKTAHKKHVKEKNILLVWKIFHIIRYIKSASSYNAEDSKSL